MVPPVHPELVERALIPAFAGRAAPERPATAKQKTCSCPLGAAPGGAGAGFERKPQLPATLCGRTGTSAIATTVQQVHLTPASVARGGVGCQGWQAACLDRQETAEDGLAGYLYSTIVPCLVLKDIFSVIGEKFPAGNEFFRERDGFTVVILD